MSEKAREISRQMRDAAKKNHERVMQLKEAYRTSGLEIGWIGREMKDKNQFPLLGFDSENEYRKSIKMGRSSWFRYVGLADAFKKLAKSEFLKLIAENADHLAKLEEGLRYSPALIKKAQTLTEEEFEKALVKHRGAREGKTEDDVVVTLKIRLTEGQRKAIASVFEWFAKKHDIPVDNVAKILELICAEIRHREPVVTAVMRVMGKLTPTIQMLNGGGDKTASAMDVMNKAHDNLTSIVRDMCTACGVKTPEELTGNAASLR